MFITKRFRSDYFKRMTKQSSMQRLKASMLIQDFYRHWKWAQAVKETIKIVGPRTGLVRQSGYRVPFDFLKKYVKATPSWCCPAKNHDIFHLSKQRIVDKLVEMSLKEMNKYPLTLDRAQKNMASIKIQRQWRRYILTCYDPKNKVIKLQRLWRHYKVRKGAYFKLTSKCIGVKPDNKVYQHQENKIWSIKHPYAPCSLLAEEPIRYPIDQSMYLVKILV